MNKIISNYEQADSNIKRWGRPVVATGLACMIGLLSACSDDKSSDKKKPQSPPVQVMEVEPQDITLVSEFTGQVSSAQEVELRARVSGVLEEKHFKDGDMVEKGQLLFSIDDRDFKAKLQEAKASLSKAEADYTRAKLDVDRYQPLLKTQAIARQVYDNAVATMKSAASQIENGKGAVKQAELSVEYASVKSPVTGQIGAATVDIGDLITAGSTLMAEISAVDTSWVYFSVSEPKLLEYQRVHGTDAIEEDEKQHVTVRLIFSDGTMYGEKGVINFADRALNSSTGTYRLRAEFPNPKGVLRPGMFARIQLATETEDGVLAVPEKAVTQLLNDFYVVVVGSDSVAKHVTVKVGDRQDGLWIIESGLKAGDQVVVEGVQRARDGGKVKITNANNSTNTASDSNDKSSSGSDGGDASNSDSSDN